MRKHGREFHSRQPYLEMDAIAIKENGSHILVYMLKPGNMFCFIIPRAVMAIGSPKISVLKYENRL